ncbi:MAG: hypothetical protein QOH81_1413 [Sphingomonadales bacterium]|jgi:hypothetical protein|nr:hypothetical protein [Sphingomonadales bacterium]
MKKAVLILAGGSAGVVALALAGGALAQGGAGGGTAVYWMTADTMSGMAGMMGGGGRPSGGAMLGAMFGRGGGMGGGYVKNLHLQLGGNARPAGEPNAEHLPPAGLGAGPTLPLVTPREVRATEEPTTPGMPPHMERPRGRMLIYWGCGEHARPGQPVVIDFATMTAGRIPPAFATMNVGRETPPSSSRFPTYGEWPNQRSQTRVPQSASLVGAHVVHGNYSPEIRFSMAPGQDFLAPVTLVSNSPAPTGAVPVAWQPVPGARAWYATAMGAGQNGDFVMWSSSEVQAMPMIDYLPDGEIARLVQQRVLMPAPTDHCTVPAEVARAAGQGMFTLTALGGEANFSHPVRPARAPASWRPDWLVKFRVKSAYMGLLGMTMPGMDGRDEEQGQNQGDQGQGQDGKKKKKGLLKGLGGILGH